MYTREVDNPATIQYIILFTMSKAEKKVTHSQLTSLTLDCCNINFANFRIALDNLVNIGYIEVLENPADEKMPIYALTEKGVQANGFFEKSIPIYIREQIAQHIKPFFEAESLKRSVRAEIVPLESGGCNAKFALYDSTSPLLELTFFAGDRKTAAKMVRNFKASPETVYTQITAALLGGEEE